MKKTIGDIFTEETTKYTKDLKQLWSVKFMKDLFTKNSKHK